MGNCEIKYLLLKSCLFSYIFSYKVWHYSGTLLHERPWNKLEELYDINWQHFPHGTFKDPIIKEEKIEGIATTQPQASKQAYRPPCARGRPLVSFKLHDDEPPCQPEKRTKNK